MRKSTKMSHRLIRPFSFVVHFLNSITPLVVLLLCSKPRASLCGLLAGRIESNLVINYADRFFRDEAISIFYYHYYFFSSCGELFCQKKVRLKT